MSSQVISTIEQQSESETEIEPGRQKNFYRHVSGAGEGQALQTTAEFATAPQHVVKPQLDHADKDETETGQDQLTNGNTESKADPHLEPDWQKKIRSLQDQVLLT